MRMILHITEKTNIGHVLVNHYCMFALFIRSCLRKCCWPQLQIGYRDRGNFRQDLEWQVFGFYIKPGFLDLFPCS